MRLLSEPLQAITPDDIKQLCLDQVSEGTELAASKKAPIIQNATSDNRQWHVYTISRSR